jgi:adenine C2-methylase RlmN of 23S rRNA A2503 and tRNA A37
MLINTSFFQIIIHLIFYLKFDHSSYSYSRNANIEKFESFLEELLLINQVRKHDICIVYIFF